MTTFEQITNQNKGEDVKVPEVKQQTGPAKVTPQTNSLVDASAQQEKPRISYAEFFERTSPYRPPTPQELEKEKKRQKSQAIVSALSDGISSLSNLYFTTQGAPNMYDPSNSLSANAKKRWDKLKAEREAKTKDYWDNYYRMKEKDDALAEQDRNFKLRMEQIAKQDKRYNQEQQHQRERERIADERYDQQQQYQKERDKKGDEYRQQVRADNAQYRKDMNQTRRDVARAAGAKGVRGKQLGFSDGQGNEVGIYENVWKGSMQQVYDTLVNDLRPKDEKGARSWDRRMKKLTQTQKSDFVKQYWTKSPKASAIMLALSKIDPATMSSGLADDDDDFSEYRTSSSGTSAEDDFSQYKVQ